MKHEIKDPSTTTEADRALRLRKDLADAQAKLLELNVLRERASRVAALERDLASATARCQELEEKVLRLSKRPTQARLQRAEVLASEVEGLRDKARRVGALERALRESEERAATLEARLRERPAPTPRHVERFAQEKLREAEQWREQAAKATRLSKDLAAAQEKLQEAEQWREQAAKAARLERELAKMDARRQELELQVGRLNKRPSQARLRRAEALAAEVEGLRSRAQRVPALERELAAAQAKLQEAEQQAKQASKASKLEREAATLRKRVAELEGQVQRLRERPSPRQLQEAEDRAASLEVRLRERPAPTPRHVERCAQAKLNRRLFAENERLKQEERGDG